MRLIEQLRAALANLPGVEESSSRFGARGRPAWSVSGREFAHLHADDLLDIRLPRRVQSSLLGDPRARFRKGRSEWLEFEFHTSEDVVHVALLARLAWAAAKKPST
jgi:Family of unknown function (DUF5519)